MFKLPIPATLRRFATALAVTIISCVGQMAMAQTYGATLTVFKDGGTLGALNTGTEVYCPASGPTVTGSGCDFSANDGFIRTNDQIEYDFSYNLNGAPDTNVVVTGVLPAGFAWPTTLPGFCIAGSTVNASTRTLNCVRGNKAAGFSETLPFAVLVSGARNADALTLAMTVRGGSTQSAGATASMVTVTAKPRVSAILGCAGNAAIGTSTCATALGYNAVLGSFLNAINIALLVDNTDGRALFGHEALQSPFSVSVDISGTTPNTRIITGAEASSVGAGTPCLVSQLNSLATGGAPATSVMNSGACGLTQPGGAGTAVIVTFTGVDSSAAQTPTAYGSGGAIPAANKLIGQYVFRLSTPLADIDATDSIMGNNIGSKLLTLSINDSTPGLALTGNSVSGVANQNALDRTPDNVASATARLAITLGSVKQTRGPIWPTYNYANGVYNTPNQEGPVTPGETYSSGIGLGNNGTSTLTNAVACDVLDTRYQEVQLPPHTYFQTPSLASYFVFEYATGYVSAWPPTTGAPASKQVEQECSDPSVVWTTDVSQFSASVPITKWRLKAATLPAGIVQVGLVQYVAKAGPTGSILPNYVVFRADEFKGDNVTAGTWANNTYNAFANNTIGARGTGNTGARVFLSNASVSITKKTDDPASAAAHPTDTINNVSTGGTLRYYLQPVVTSGASASTANITITDILPAGLSLSAATQGGVPLAPVSSTSCTGAGAGVGPAVASCTAAGQTVLIWSLGVRPANVVITPLVVDTVVSANAVGPLVNTVIISAPEDASLAAQRTATRSVGVQSPVAIVVSKSVNYAYRSLPGSLLNYTLSYANNTGLSLNRVSVIDVLPKVGESRVPATSFAGTLALNALGTMPAGVTVEYTLTAPSGISDDPAAASNLPAGSTVWCAALSGGACPSSLGQVTALRFTDNTVFPNGTASRNLGYVLSASGGSVSGQIVSNSFGANSDKTPLVARSNVVSTTFLISSISGTVYRDFNNDGVKAAGEPGIDNVQICLSGYGYGADGVDNNGGGDDVAVTAGTCQTTTGGGTYSFTGLSGGKYNLTQTRALAQSPGLAASVDGKDVAGSAGGVVVDGAGVADDQITGITLALGTSAGAYNFGEGNIVSGTVYLDANGLSDSTVNGTGTQAGSGSLTAYLINASNQIVASSPVSAAGAYAFSNIAAATYTVVLSNTAGLVNGAGAPAPGLPAGWVNTGEFIGAGTGSDGTVNGASAPFAVSGSVDNINFGIKQPPVSGNAVYAGQPNPGGTATVAVGAGAFVGALPGSVTGSNANDPTPGGSIAQIKITAFPSNTTSITLNGVVYVSGAAGSGQTSFPAGGVTVTVAQLAGMLIDPADGIVSPVIPYVAIDAAGLVSGNTGSVTLSFTGVAVSGNVFQDNNGLLGTPVNTVDGPGTNTGSSSLTAYLTNSSGTIVASSVVSASGAFGFTGIAPAAGYKVVLSNSSGLSGVLSAGSLPAGWVNTGEFNGTGAGSDANADGVSASFTVASGDVSNINFGIEQAPTAGTATLPGQLNPGGSLTVAVAAGNFTGTMPAGVAGSNASDATAVTDIRFTAFPANVTSITLNGVAYVNGGAGSGQTNFPAGGVTLSVAQLTGIAIDPTAGPVTASIPYVAIDAAGKESSPGAVLVPFAGVSLSGTVFNDANGLLGTPANTVDGTGSNAGSSSLSAYLVNGAGTIVASSPVAANGTYAFNGVAAGVGYRVVLANTSGLNGVLASGSLPAGWSNTGENIGSTAGSDGTPDGLSAPFTVASADISNINFGINRLPDTVSINAASQNNPGGVVRVPVPALSGTDPEDGAKGPGSSFQMVTLPNPASMGVLYYNSVAVTAGQIIANYDPAKLSFDPVEGPVTAVFQVAAVDAAGQTDASPATVTLPFTQLSLSGTVFGDANGSKIQDASESAAARPVPNGLNAVLSDAAGTVIAVMGINPATGTFTFPVAPNASYSVLITTASPAPGSSNASVTLAAPWVVTGENLAGAIDTLADGKQMVAVGANGVSNLNFGIEQLPDTTAVSAAAQSNPGGSLQAPVPALAGADAEDGVKGSGSSFQIVTLPAPATMGVLYYNGVAVVAGQIITSYDPAKLTFDPVDGPVTASFQVASIDAAGKADPTPAPVSMSFSQLSLSGTVFYDADGSRLQDPALESASAKPVPAGLNAVLTDASGKVLAVAGIAPATGHFSFPVAPNASYQVLVTTATPAVGAHLGAAGAATLPSGWVSTGENLAGVVDAAVDSRQSVAIAGNGISGVNFGIAQSASLSGRAWRDINHNRAYEPGEPVVPGIVVEVLNPAGNVVASLLTDASGAYSAGGLIPGITYSLRFRDKVSGGIIFGTPTNNDATPNAVLGSTYTNSGGARSTIDMSASSLQVKLVPGNNLANQSLPLDPSGVIYDAVQRTAIEGATVLFSTAPAGFDAAAHLVGGAANSVQVTGPTGAYQFLLNPGAPAGQYCLAASAPGYLQPFSQIAPAGASFTSPAGLGVVSINKADLSGVPPPQIGQDTTYYMCFVLDPLSSKGVVNNHIPLDPGARAVLMVSKTGDRSVAELGDSLKYTVRVRNNGNAVAPLVKLVDNLPAGFTLIAGTSTYTAPGASSAVIMADPIGAKTAQLTFALPATLGLGEEALVTYRVRLNVGAREGDGINKVRANSGTIQSNEARFAVKVTAGVFTPTACVVGKVYVDCNGNHMQDGEEPGIPGVRLYMQNGLMLVSDVEGKYSSCGLPARTHTLKVDATTLPRGARLTTSSSRNVGDAGSLFLDLKNGELHRADFIEGSCSNPVMEQVKARRSHGEVRSNAGAGQGSPAGPGLTFRSKPRNAPQQATDSANQPPVPAVR